MMNSGSPNSTGCAFSMIIFLIVPDFEAVIALALVAASTFAIVDTMMPSLSTPLNMGVGFGIGANLVNFPGGY